MTTTTETAKKVQMRLELVHIPVTDVDRGRDFYVKQCGWELLTDHVQLGAMRICQIVPPGSGCAILMGENMPEISDMPPGVQKGIHLVVDDMDEACAFMRANGVKLDETQEIESTLFTRFEDPDGNSWLLQQWPKQ